MSTPTPDQLKNVPKQLRSSSAKLIERSSKGLGIKHKQKPVSLLLPPELDEFVRSLPSGKRSEWLRAAVAEKYEREKAN